MYLLRRRSHGDQENDILVIEKEFGRMKSDAWQNIFRATLAVYLLVVQR